MFSFTYFFICIPKLFCGFTQSGIIDQPEQGVLPLFHSRAEEASLAVADGVREGADVACDRGDAHERRLEPPVLGLRPVEDRVLEGGEVDVGGRDVGGKLRPVDIGQADDAVLVDTSDLTIDEVADKILAIIDEKI